jgi:hypothetical protein
MPITAAHLDNWFQYHAPKAEPIPTFAGNGSVNGETTQQQAYEDLRAAGRDLAGAIMRLTPPSADQTAAIRKVREAVMTANAAIACEGK